MREPLVSQSFHHFLFSNFSGFVNQEGEKQYVIVVLICIALIKNEFEHVFIFFLAMQFFLLRLVCLCLCLFFHWLVFLYFDF